MADFDNSKIMPVNAPPVPDDRLGLLYHLYLTMTMTTSTLLNTMMQKINWMYQTVILTKDNRLLGDSGSDTMAFVAILEVQKPNRKNINASTARPLLTPRKR